MALADTPETARGQRGPALLAAARELFFERGYAGTTIAEVATRAGFSKRTVYLYFKNKDELFIAVASEGLEILQRSLESIDIDAHPVEDLIRFTMERYVEFAYEEPDYFRIIFQEATTKMMERVSPEVRDRVAQQERACLQTVATIVEKAVDGGITPSIDPWETAVIFWGTCTGIILLSLGGSQTVFNRSSREELISKAIWTLYQGLKAAAPGAAFPGRKR